MSKKITISLNEKELVLNFGIPRFYNLFKEATGKDLLMYQSAQDEISILIEIVQGLVYGGYYAECKKEKITPEFSKEQLLDMVLDSDSSFIKEVYEKYIESVSKNGVAPGEVVSQLEK